MPSTITCVSLRISRVVHSQTASVIFSISLGTVSSLIRVSYSLTSTIGIGSSLIGSALDVQAPALGAQNEIEAAVGDVVQGDGRKGFDERAAPLRAQLVLHSAVDDHRLAGAERSGLRTDGHLQLAVQHEHHLLGLLVRVARHVRAWLVADAT